MTVDNQSSDISSSGDVTLVEIGRALVVPNRLVLKQRVIDLLEAGHRRFVFDFSNTGYVDSSGIGVLFSLRKKIQAHGGTLSLLGLNEDLRTLFELTKLDTVFDLLPPVPGAKKKREKEVMEVRFADPRKEAASRGGRAAHAKGTAHEFDSGEAREAGRKGGLAVSQNRAHMAKIGKAGGLARGKARDRAKQTPVPGEVAKGNKK